MGRYVIRRLLQAIPVLLGSTFLIFCTVYALPGDPVMILGGERRIDPVLAAQLREQYGLNDPLIVQYWNYISGVFVGDFGETFQGVQVADLFAGKFQVTIQLAVTALIIEALVGLGLGLYAALRRGRWQDHAVLALTLLLLSRCPPS
ncbi:ABC transporter permease [Nonomuraea dietziae]|uniref:ABC transporter permease n=1 Tax=Nonomuraea dietziae TaxID=65515 RepID=UPI0031E08385